MPQGIFFERKGRDGWKCKVGGGEEGGEGSISY